jgi:hypothetical protein
MQEYTTQNNSETLSNTYLYGSYLDDPIAYVYNDNTYYYVKDSRYSVMAITDKDSNIVERYEYSPYGVSTIFDSDNNPLEISSYNNSYGFTGRKI